MISEFFLCWLFSHLKRQDHIASTGGRLPYSGWVTSSVVDQYCASAILNCLVISVPILQFSATRDWCFPNWLGYSRMERYLTVGEKTFKTDAPPPPSLLPLPPHQPTLDGRSYIAQLVEAGSQSKGWSRVK